LKKKLLTPLTYPGFQVAFDLSGFTDINISGDVSGNFLNLIFEKEIAG